MHKYPGKWKLSQFLVMCIIVNHMVPCALSMEGVRKVGAPGTASRTLPTSSMLMWWKMSLDPVTSQQYRNNQHLAQICWLSPTVWGGASGRTVEMDETSHLFIPGKAFLRASQLDCAARNARGQSPYLPGAILLQPPRCSFRMELEKSIEPQVLGLFAWLENISLDLMHWLHREQNEGNPLHFLSTRRWGK